MFSVWNLLALGWGVWSWKQWEVWVSGYYSGSTPWLIRCPWVWVHSSPEYPGKSLKAIRTWKRNCLLGDNVNLSLHRRLSLHWRMKFLASFWPPVSQTPRTFKFKLLSCARGKRQNSQKKQRPYQQWEHDMASQTFLNLLNAGGKKKKKKTQQQKQQWEWVNMSGFFSGHISPKNKPILKIICESNSTGSWWS